MKQRNNNQHSGELLSVLTFFLFTAAMLLVILVGAKIYKSIVRSGTLRFERRTVSQYLSTRIHQADSVDALIIEEFGDADALVIQEELDGNTYRTIIYSYDRWLRELFCAEDSSLSPADGEKLMPLRAVAFSKKEDGILVQTVSLEGDTAAFYVYLRSHREELPCETEQP